MTKVDLKKYNPNWVAPPGDTIKENLEIIGMTQIELAKRMGMAKENINEILSGKSTITPETAIKFKTVLGISAQFILRLENSYRIYLAERKVNEKQEKEMEFLNKIPYKQMVKKGWIEKSNDKVETIKSVKQFFGVDSFNNLDNVYAFFRKGKAVKENKYAVIAWLRKGELETQVSDIPSYNKVKLKTKISKIRSFSNFDFNEIREKLTKELADCGVAISYVSCLKQTPIYGAVKWMKPDKPFIIMSLRYKTNGQFWFTLMHELYHILYPQKTSIIIDEKDHKDEYEIRANKFASRTLIPDSKYNEFIQKGIFTKNTILSFAEQMDIATGVIVGRLQHDKHIPHKKLNELKIKYYIGDL